MLNHMPDVKIRIGVVFYTHLKDYLIMHVRYRKELLCIVWLRIQKQIINCPTPKEQPAGTHIRTNSERVTA